MACGLICGSSVVEGQGIGEGGRGVTLTGCATARQLGSFFK